MLNNNDNINLRFHNCAIAQRRNESACASNKRQALSFTPLLCMRYGGNFEYLMFMRISSGYFRCLQCAETLFTSGGKFSLVTFCVAFFVQPTAPQKKLG